MNYSVIIPHYNIPSLLKRCIDSIPIRNDVEIIIVDDKSDDCHKPQLHDIAESRPNIKLIELTENRGGGHARNKGLEATTGKWVLFADSDDYFNYCIRDIMDEYINCDADIIFFKLTTSNCYTYEFSPRSTLETNKYVDALIENKSDAVDNIRYLHGVPYAKLIRRRLVNNHNIKFDNTRMADDTTFAYLTGYHATNIKGDKRTVYNVTVRDGSVSRQKSLRHRFDIIDVLGRGTIFSRSNGKCYFENYLAANLYLFIRERDYADYNTAIGNLEKMGLEQRCTENIIINEMGKYSLKSILSCALFMPSLRLRLKSLCSLFTNALPYHVKKKLHKI
ncbi:MAG: glycosyltransferase [Pseudoflavonifractor sp.]|nr:glycosyltransferase [Pseudoflavonifractor sp.]